MNSSVLSCVLAALVAVALLSAAAVDAEPNRLPKDRNPAQLNFQVGGRAITLVARADSGTAKTRLRFDARLDGFPRIRVSYLTVGTGSSGGVDTSRDANITTFRVGYRRLIEFNDSGSPCINRGDGDEYVGTIMSLLSRANAWSNWAHTTVSVNGASYERFCSNLTQSSTQLFGLCLSISDQILAIGPNNQTTLSPNFLKVDVYAQGITYTAPASQLALVAVVESASVATLSSSAGSVSLADGGFFDFSSTMTVGPDLSNQNAVSTVISSTGFISISDFAAGDVSGAIDSGDTDYEASETVYRQFFCPGNTTRPASFNWDPVVGLSAAADHLPSVLVLLALALVAMLGVVSF